MDTRPANVFRFRDRNGKWFYVVAVREGDKWTQIEPGGKAKRVSDTLRFFIISRQGETGRKNAHRTAKLRYGYSKMAPVMLDTHTQKSYNDSK